MEKCRQRVGRHGLEVHKVAERRIEELRAVVGLAQEIGECLHSSVFVERQYGKRVSNVR